ncbi:hypothetical protein [Actinoplanes sp. NBRC 103695]|uniref:hypothetical protein n=1 Tax=Actinoplanes sp. NBRC 103695 TaxID=3032202 RepID=UPI0024A5D257|nr:hypothetical protein [Actinoplanes sp. NBRC 103695]GLY95461.1 hypothetical protein Acsp02_27160 [Actinoplanes sp. NBRC 103695]
MRSWWAGGVVLGLVAVGGGVYLLARVGLEDADRWAGVLGLFLNAAGLAIAVVSLVKGRRASGNVSNRVSRGEFDESVTMARDVNPADPQSGDVRNAIGNGRFHGPVIMGRDVHEKDQ